MCVTLRFLQIRSIQYQPACVMVALSLKQVFAPAECASYAVNKTAAKAAEIR